MGSSVLCSPMRADVRVVEADGEAEDVDELLGGGEVVAGDEGDLAQSEHGGHFPWNRGVRFSTKAENASPQSADAVIVPWALVSMATNSPNAHRLGGDVVRLHAAPGERRRARRGARRAARTSARNTSSSNAALTSPIAAASSAVSFRGSSDSSRATPGADEPRQRPRQAHVAGDGDVEERGVELGRAGRVAQVAARTPSRARRRRTPR